MTAVELAVLQIIAEPGFLGRANARAAQLEAGLKALVERHGLIGERGTGLLRALVLPEDKAADIFSRARDLAPEGLLLNAPRGNLLRLLPALTVSEGEVGVMLGMLYGLLEQMR